MHIPVNALLCGIVGAIAANVTYVQSNLFILGDATRRGRHPLWDPAYFAALALVAGLVIGAVCAARFFSTSPVKAALVGLGITLAGIAASHRCSLHNCAGCVIAHNATGSRHTVRLDPVLHHVLLKRTLTARS